MSRPRKLRAVASESGSDPRDVRKRATPLGRPRKPAREKAQAVTLTLWRDEFDALDQRLAQIQRASPGHVSRSDLVRVALALLARLSDDEVIRLLIVLRDARRDL